MLEHGAVTRPFQCITHLTLFDSHQGETSDAGQSYCTEKRLTLAWQHTKSETTNIPFTSDHHAG